MLSKKLQNEINEQINRELYSEYLYLSMGSYCRDIGLDGIANWFEIQAQEEHFHAMKFYYFLYDKGARVYLKEIKAPQTEFKSVKQCYEMSLEHEKYITKSINDIALLATKEKDFSVSSFLNWYIDEQVEEEASVETILNKLKIVGSEGPGLYMLDQELGSRTFTPPPLNE